MSEDQTYVSIGRADDFAANSLRVVKVDGEEVVVARVEGAFYAFSNYCPHDELPMVSSYFVDCAVVCVHHGAAFDVRTGDVLRQPSYGPLAVYDVRIEADEVFIGRREAVAPASTPG